MPRTPALATVTGIGCVCAAGRSLEAVLDNLEANPPVPEPPKRFLEVVETPYPVFEVRDDLEPPADHGLALLLESALQAVATAGLAPKDLLCKCVGICIGSSVGFAVNYLPLYKAWHQGNALPKALLDVFRHSNYALSLKERLGLTGPCQLVANACASGTDSIGIGASWIASGMCDMVLAGGAESLSIVSYLGFSRLMIADTAPCRPFDRTRNGLNLGEGAALFLLEPAATPRPGLGYIRGYGSASDAFHLTAPHPAGRGLRRAMAEAMRQAAVTPREVAFINAHGTGTRDNDKVEGLVIRNLLPDIPVLATKGATGHTLGAAGAIEASITLGCLNRGTIPASHGFCKSDPEVGVNPTTHPVKLESRIALSDSLAFGGSNAVLVLEGKRK
ncbi:beta-ketoacyl-[acyl-carrier-protein] synthase family protein [Desulfovibrio aerotolerans]|uniref:Beta-ketoacyl-[acyl-carrier-protein] synthase family protein n=1 Tax=Solidesulfovibrio aerotolerans TaxID=295255 RepID=A0A7C9ML43_9BACT|nr:beta-ketoacyl-[acyl-carrier-protein] synthase family protein [Solidesulfovibrio aerotolerans]MYL84809.1 beta-ketoacyl-[acyl-carrier-protein] synthase family protein [Solidesulfovibrio aerotolerans]